MAQIQPTFVVHPSDGVTASQLAALYGLSNGEWIEGPSPANTWPFYIHLYVRDDGAYCDIKQELGNEDGTAFYTDLIAQNRVHSYRFRRHRTTSFY